MSLVSTNLNQMKKKNTYVTNLGFPDSSELDLPSCEIQQQKINN